MGSMTDFDRDGWFTFRPQTSSAGVLPESVTVAVPPNTSSAPVPAAPPRTHASANGVSDVNPDTNVPAMMRCLIVQSKLSK